MVDLDKAIAVANWIRRMDDIYGRAIERGTYTYMFLRPGLDPQCNDGQDKKEPGNGRPPE